MCVILDVQFKLYISSNVEFNKNYNFKKKFSFFYLIPRDTANRSSVRLSIRNAVVS